MKCRNKFFNPFYYRALGFQLSRYGYTGTAEIRSVVKDMLDAEIPLVSK